jgi:hypothetical protein
MEIWQKKRDNFLDRVYESLTEDWACFHVFSAIKEMN